MATADTVLAQPQGIAGVRAKVRELRLPWVPIVILSIILFMAIFANLLAPHNPKKNNILNRLSPPAADLSNPLGTDNLGKDVLSRCHGCCLR